MGKFRGAMLHLIFPKARFYPVVRPGARTKGRSCTTALTF